MKKLLTLGVAPLAVAGIVGVSGLSASALNGQGSDTGNQTGSRHGNGQGNGYQASLESRAKVLGMSVKDLKNALENKTMSQIAKEKGMTESDFQAKMAEAAKARWEARGLSSEEIAKQTAEREKRHTANSADHEWGSDEGNHQGGYGRNRQ